LRADNGSPLQSRHLAADGVFNVVPTRSEVIQAYLRAKDENRPHLMRLAFAEGAELEMTVETGTISFPPIASGIDAITQVLVRNFGQVYENVYTFCLTEPPSGNRGIFRCRWLVGMSEKSSGTVRVGCGYYDWSFQCAEPHRVERLGITIEMMEVLPSDDLRPVMDWLPRLPYPWCPAGEATKRMPDLAALEQVRRFIDQGTTDK
jgi:hypothetical protein